MVVGSSSSSSGSSSDLSSTKQGRLIKAEEAIHKLKEQLNEKTNVIGKLQRENTDLQEKLQKKNTVVKDYETVERVYKEDIEKLTEELDKHRLAVQEKERVNVEQLKIIELLRKEKEDAEKKVQRLTKELEQCNIQSSPLREEEDYDKWVDKHKNPQGDEIDE